MEIEGLSEKDKEFEQRIAALEFEVEMLKKRPISDGKVNIDVSSLVSVAQFDSLVARMKKVENRNEEQDLRLTNNELRIEKLEDMMKKPNDRLAELEAKVANLTFQMNNKVNIQDLYNELIKKADINELKVLEAGLIRMNEILADLRNQFADRIENDKAHKLLQKNLKNLYDLFMSLKGEGGNVDDPMFTTKHLHCASCAKGVHNMIGFRADHYNWNNFPFKDPNTRMAKMGQGFSKQFT